MKTFPNPPASALLVRPDGVGDLVLFSPVLRALHTAWPRTRLAVVVRPAVAEIGALLAPGVEWIATSIDPYVTGPGEAADEVGRLRREVTRLAPELFVAACPRRHWLDAALAAAAPGARRVAFVSAGPDPFYEVPLRFELNVQTVEAFEEIMPALAQAEEWRRNFGLASALLGRTVPPAPPRIEPDAAVLARADQALKRAGLKAGGFVSCAAAGFANVFLKTWPPDRFAAAIGWLWRERGLRTLLVGHATERDYLARIAAQAGAEVAEVWTGADGELATLVGILARARLHFGNDSGAAHVAAAVGTALVTVFGGGTWPRFVPASESAVSLVHPLPCFGCGWDCAFGDAPCVKLVGLDEVERALGAALDGRFSPGVVTLASVPPEAADRMREAAAISRERASAHLERQRKLQEIAYLSREKDVEIAALKGAADEKDAEIRLLKRAADEKDAEIRLQAHAAEERLAVINLAHGAVVDASAEAGRLKAAATERQEKLQELHVACEELRRVCDDRLRVIERLDRECRELRKTAEERLTAIGELTRRVRELEDGRTELR